MMPAYLGEVGLPWNRLGPLAAPRQPRSRLPLAPGGIQCPRLVAVQLGPVSALTHTLRLRTTTRLTTRRLQRRRIVLLLLLVRVLAWRIVLVLLPRL